MGQRAPQRSWGAAQLAAADWSLGDYSPPAAEPRVLGALQLKLHRCIAAAVAGGGVKGAGVVEDEAQRRRGLRVRAGMKR